MMKRIWMVLLMLAGSVVNAAEITDTATGTQTAPSQSHVGSQMDLMNPFQVHPQALKELPGGGGADTLIDSDTPVHVGTDSTSGHESLPDDLAPKIMSEPRQCYALLVGYNIFENDPVHPEEYSRNDVSQMSTLLRQKGVAEGNILCMTGDRKELWLRPTRQNILGMLRLLADQVTENDVFIIMFSGIGGCVSEETCFLPLGATLSSGQGWITQSEVCEILTHSKARQMILIELVNRRPVRNISVDEIGCGHVSWKVMADEVLSPELPSIWIVNSCSKNEIADESQEMKTDLFLGTVLKLIKEPHGQEHIPLLNLFTRTCESVQQITGARELGPQHPELNILVP